MTGNFWNSLDKLNLTNSDTQRTIFNRVRVKYRRNTGNNLRSSSVTDFCVDHQPISVTNLYAFLTDEDSETLVWSAGRDIIATIILLPGYRVTVL